MMYYGNGMGAGGWVLVILAVALVTLLVVMVVGRPLDSHGSAFRRAAGPTPTGPEEALADRFARGEIDTEEYEQRLRTLRAANQQR